jgi:hypothetical protein
MVRLGTRSTRSVGECGTDLASDVFLVGVAVRRHPRPELAERRLRHFGREGRAQPQLAAVCETPLTVEVQDGRQPAAVAALAVAGATRVVAMAQVACAAARIACEHRTRTLDHAREL